MNKVILSLATILSLASSVSASSDGFEGRTVYESERPALVETGGTIGQFRDLDPNYTPIFADFQKKQELKKYLESKANGEGLSDTDFDAAEVLRLEEKIADLKVKYHEVYFALNFFEKNEEKLRNYQGSGEEFVKEKYEVLKEADKIELALRKELMDCYRSHNKLSPQLRDFNFIREKSQEEKIEDITLAYHGVAQLLSRD